MIGIGLLFSFLSSVLLFELVRRRKIKERMALYWASFPILVLIFAIDPFITESISNFLGFRLVSNFLLTSFALILSLIMLYLSAMIGKMEDKINSLAQEIAAINGNKES